MPKYKSNEWEFQGEVLKWLQAEISKRPGMGLDKATQEPSRITAHRSDLIVWQDRAAEIAFLSWELKKPDTPITSPALLSDACSKAQRWGAPFFAIWNMRVAELYRTPSGRDATPSDRVRPTFPLNERVSTLGTKYEAQVYREVLAQLSIHDRATEPEIFGSVAIGD